MKQEIENEPKVTLPEPPAGKKWEYRGRGWASRNDTEVCYTEDRIPEVHRKTGSTTGYPDTHYWEAVPAPTHGSLKRGDEDETNPIRLRQQRDAWQETAAQHLRNESYYRDLLDQCARAIGRPAFTCDDGTTQDEPLRAKVPGLVREMVAEKADLIDEIKRKSAMITQSVMIEIAPDPTEGGKYRMLEAREVLERGDEFLLGDKEWYPTLEVGSTTGAAYVGRYRRPLKPDYAHQAKDVLEGVLGGGFGNSLDQFVDLIIKAAKQ